MKKFLWFRGAVILVAVLVSKTPSDKSHQSGYQPSAVQSFDQAVTKIAREHQRFQRENAQDFRDAMRRISP